MVRNDCVLSPYSLESCGVTDGDVARLADSLANNTALQALLCGSFSSLFFFSSHLLSSHPLLFSLQSGQQPARLCERRTAGRCPETQQNAASAFVGLLLFWLVALTFSSRFPSLDNNPIGDLGTQELAEALKVNPTLQRL